MSLSTDITSIHEAIRDDIRRASAQLAEAELAIAADTLLTTLQAASPAERATLWAGLDLGMQHQLAAAALRRVGHAVTTDAVLIWVEALASKFSPAPMARAIATTHSQMAEQASRAAATAVDPAERTFFAAERRALDKAHTALRCGHRPERQADGCWHVSSASDARAIYVVSRAGACSCQAGQHGRACWHAAAVALVEAAAAHLDTYDDAHAARTLGVRLAAIRARQQVAA